ncbi:Pesticin receptor [Zhongshania aliphaticivorans]|uniref:Pesticin receptor n=1 Tax=Zhongshania aliphaticivorans TaxID=1470434 RepID=A0A5S9P5V0_9GAMM|nr:TonB-dependent receptor plug domain-containing protein [Zhongshania aliphaticivorans]CAA0098725.1 Pesticin receptor [Zhongshania aliphaticivorans]
MKKITPIASSLCALTVCMSNPVYSQDTVKKSGYALEEVIVTAQKKAESLQDTPISLTAFGEERLEIDGISSLGDIGSKVPSLTIEPFPINNATLRIFIRGIGIADVQVTQDPPVGIYVDGVYIARSTGTALDVAELQRIEVLRGPQGTLYGRNTTGGAINLVTKRPTTDAFELKQKFTVGNRGLFTSKTSANIPLGDTLAAKVAYLTTQSDGFIDNTGPGGDFGDKEVNGYRIDLRWDISDSMTLDYAYDNSGFEYYNTMYQSINPAIQNKGQAEPIREFAVSESIHSADRFDSMATSRNFEESTTDIEGHSFILTKDFDNMQFKYIGAYRELRDASYADLGGGAGSEDYRVDSHEYCGPAVTAQTGSDCLPLVIPVISQEQFSHEFQLSGSLFNDSLDYILGAYYFEEEATEDNSPLHHQFSAKLSNDIIPIPVLGEILGGVLVGAGDLHMVNMLSQRYDIKNEAKAVFGQFTWTPNLFDKRMHLTFGARYSDDSREALKNQTDKTYIESRTLNLAIDTEDLSALSPVLAQAGFLLPGDRSFDNILGQKDFDDLSFSFIAEFDITDDINVYGKYVQAYKSGGFNTRDPQRGSTGYAEGTAGKGDDTAVAAPDGNVYGFGFADGFDEEHVASLEAGIKSELMDRRLRVNANVFFSEYTDIQLNFILGGTVADTKVTNAGEAEMQGFETDITFLATENLMFMLNYAYLDTEVTKAFDEFGNDLTDTFGFYSAPQQSYTASADYTVGQYDWGQLAINLSYNYMDKRRGGVRDANAKNVYIGEYGLFNGRISFSEIQLSNYGTLYLGLWGKNLTDEEYEITAIDNIPHSDRSVIWGTPISYGLDVIYQY